MNERLSIGGVIHSPLTRHSSSVQINTATIKSKVKFKFLNLLSA